MPKKVRLPPSGIVSIPIDDKTMYISTNQTNYSSAFLFWNGYEKFEYADIFVQLIQDMESFYDIGANIGFFSLLAGIKKPNMHIVCFEPARGPFHYLVKNMDINGMSSVIVEDVALSHKDGEITFYEIENTKYPWLKYNLAGIGNTGSRTTASRPYAKKTVSTTTLDSYVKKDKLDRVDLIKIDTEGTEHQILQNGTDTIRRYKPVIICETLFNQIEGDLEDILRPLGYKFFNHHEGKGLQEVNSIRREFDDGVRNCFFVHQSKVDLIERFLFK